MKGKPNQTECPNKKVSMSHFYNIRTYLTAINTHIQVIKVCGHVSGSPKDSSKNSLGSVWLPSLFI